MSVSHTVTLLMSEFVTHHVRRFVVNRPPGFEYRPGQGVELAIDRPGWTQQARPFTPTGLADDRVLEFTIKHHPEHAGATRELHDLGVAAGLLLSEPFGTITDRGPGAFIAGGAGITPLLTILRERARAGTLADCTLVFSNKTPDDIICEKVLAHHLGDRCLRLCTDTAAPGHDVRRIDRDFLAARIADFDQRFYVCGPAGFMKAVNTAPARRTWSSNTEARDTMLTGAQLRAHSPPRAAATDTGGA